MTKKHEPILIIGGTGKTGRRVAEKLAAQGVPIRVASRSAETIFDWNDRSTWAPAMEGVSAAYVTYSPDLAVPEAPRAIEEIAALATEHGLERLVLLSGRGEEEARRCERIILETNPSWTIVRASWFNQNFSESFFLEPLRGGVLALPAGEVEEPFVDAEDIADVAVAALTETGHERVMRRFVDEVINQGDTSSLESIVHPDYVYRSPGEELHGPEGLTALLADDAGYHVSQSHNLLGFKGGSCDN